MRDSQVLAVTSCLCIRNLTDHHNGKVKVILLKIALPRIPPVGHFGAFIDSGFDGAKDGGSCLDNMINFVQIKM